MMRKELFEGVFVNVVDEQEFDTLLYRLCQSRRYRENPPLPKPNSSKVRYKESEPDLTKGIGPAY